MKEFNIRQTLTSTPQLSAPMQFLSRNLRLKRKKGLLTALSLLVGLLSPGLSEKGVAKDRDSCLQDAQSKFVEAVDKCNRDFAECSNNCRYTFGDDDCEICTQIFNDCEDKAWSDAWNDVGQCYTNTTYCDPADAYNPCN